MSEMTATLAPTKIVVEENAKGVMSPSDVKLLNHMNRCDQCGSRAYAKAWLNKPDTATLLFCGHHLRDHEASLVSQGFNIEDQTFQLRRQTKPDASA